MTDKVQKIREDVERLRNLHQMKYQQYDTNDNMCIVECGKRNLCNELLSFIDSLQEEPVGKVWHYASEEPNDKSSCLIHYIVGGEVSYRDIFPVIYNKEAKKFVSEPYPHPTGNKVWQSSLEGGVVAEVYKNMRDRFPLSDIYKWAYIDDILNLSNVERTIKDWKEESVSNPIDFEKELYKSFGQVKDFTLGMRIAKWFYDMGKQHQEPVSEDLGEYINELSKQFPEVSFAKLSRIAVRVAKWQKQQDQSTIELAEDHAMLAGMGEMKKEMMMGSTDVTVHVDAGGYPYIPQMELYDYDNDVPLAKEGDKYKVVLIKEE